MATPAMSPRGEANGSGSVTKARAPQWLFPFLVPALCYVGGWFMSENRSDAATQEKVAQTSTAIAEFRTTHVTRDEFKQLTQEIREERKSLHEELLEIRAEIQRQRR